MSETKPTPSRDTGRVVMYVVIALLVLGAAIGGVAVYRQQSVNRASLDKAAQVQAKWKALGLETPTVENIAKMYGTEGGVLCQIAPERAAKALYLIQLSNGAAGPGQRPVLASRDLVVGGRAMLEVYCPDRLPAFDQIVQGLKLTSQS